MKIFVSYSRRDAGDFADQIRSHLASFEKYEVFIDVNSIRVGEVWSNTIEENISNCDIFVVIVTHGALQSPHVEKEVLQAQREKKKIIPCFHEDVRDSDIKWGLSKIQGAKFAGNYDLARDLYSKVSKIASGLGEDNLPSPGTLLDKGITTTTETPKPHVQQDPTLQLIEKARVLLEGGQYDNAIKIFDTILMLRSGHIEALNGKGVAFCKQKKYEEALKCFQEVLKIKPRHPQASTYVDIITDRTTKGHNSEVKSSGKDIKQDTGALEKRTERKVIKALEAPHIIFQRRKYLIGNKIEIGRDHDCHNDSYKCRKGERPFYRKNISPQNIGLLDIPVHDDHKYLSKHHARVMKDRSGVCWVQDLGSLNFTAISHDGEKTFKTLRPGDKERLKDGDIVAIVYKRGKRPYMKFRFRG